MSNAECSNLGIIRSAASGEELVRLAADDLPVLAETQGTSVLALKRVLAKRINLSRFRQRLLTDDGELLHDDTLLSPPLNLQLVKLELLKPDEDRDAAFVDACAENRVAEVENRLCGLQDPNTVSIITTDDDEEHLTAFSVAVQYGHPEVVSLLLEADADTDMCGDICGETPLLSAAFNGDLDIVRLLLEAGADKEKFDIDGQTALHNASEKGHLETVRLLLESGSNRDPCDNQGRTPLHLAFEGGHLEVARLLLDSGAKKEPCDSQGRTPLHLFAKGGHLEVMPFVLQVVRLLLEEGANRVPCDNQGRTPLHLPSEGGHLELAQLLLELGADKDKEDNQQATPLHWAAKFGRFEVVDLLLKQTEKLRQNLQVMTYLENLSNVAEEAITSP